MLGSKSSVQTSDQGVSEQALLVAAKSDDSPVLPDAAAVRACPQFAMWPGMQTLTVYEKGHDGDSLAVLQRGEITQTARECDIQGGHVTIKYGFSGRVLLGPKGAPGHVSMPVNVVLTDPRKQRVMGDSLRVEIDISPDQPIGYFSAVRTVAFDVPEGARSADYKLYVAFDRAASGT
jgi:hypothetical protein